MCKEASDTSIQGPCTTATIHMQGSLGCTFPQWMHGWGWRGHGMALEDFEGSSRPLLINLSHYFEMYQYFSRAAFTVRCGRTYSFLLAESQEFKGTGSANLLEHRRQNHKVSNEENLFLRLQYIIRHSVAVHRQEGEIQFASMPSGGKDNNWQNAS